MSKETFGIGDKVYIVSGIYRWNYGTVIQKAKHLYIVKMEDGSEVMKNENELNLKFFSDQRKTKSE